MRKAPFLPIEWFLLFPYYTSTDLITYEFSRNQAGGSCETHKLFPIDLNRLILFLHYINREIEMTIKLKLSTIDSIDIQEFHTSLPNDSLLSTIVSNSQNEGKYALYQASTIMIWSRRNGDTYGSIVTIETFNKVITCIEWLSPYLLIVGMQSGILAIFDERSNTFLELGNFHTAPVQSIHVKDTVSSESFGKCLWVLFSDGYVVKVQTMILIFCVLFNAKTKHSS